MRTTFSIFGASNYFTISSPGLAAAARRQGADVVGTKVFRVTPRLGEWINMPAAIEIVGRDGSGDAVKRSAQRFRYVDGGVWEVAVN